MKIRDEIEIYVTYHVNVRPKRTKVVYEVVETCGVSEVFYDGALIGAFVYSVERDRYLVDGGSYHYMRSAVEYIFDKHVDSGNKPRIVTRIMANVGEGERI